MKILILADIDDLHWKHGSGRVDVILSCGDIDDQVIIEASKAYNCPTVFAVKGNHDRNSPFAPPIVDLHLNKQEYNGMFWGGLNGSWRYKPRGHFLYDQWEIECYLSSFPYVDIFLSHNSPRGLHDQEDEIHFGFDGLMTYIKNVKPRLVIHGHQHLNKETLCEHTRILGIYGHKLIEI